jgi:hypothetical protein
VDEEEADCGVCRGMLFAVKKDSLLMPATCMNLETMPRESIQTQKVRNSIIPLIENNQNG